MCSTSGGGLAELGQEDGRLVICSYSCPLEEAAASHPEVCLLAEMSLTELVDTRVHKRCPLDERPHCQCDVGRLPASTTPPGN